MFQRSLSLILIAAVIACPMACGSSCCSRCDARDGRPGEALSAVCAMHECAADTCAADTCAVHAMAHCGCGGSSQASDNDASPWYLGEERCADKEGQRRDGRGCPDRMVCQGVCGGAVVEKCYRFDGNDVSLILPILDHQPTTTSLAAQRRAVQMRRRSGGESAINDGRFMRVLHSSFLC